MQQHEIFKQVCAQNINTLSATDDELFLDRSRDEISFQKIQIENSLTNRRNAFNSDSDEEISPTVNDSSSMDMDRKSLFYLIFVNIGLRHIESLFITDDLKSGRL